MPDKINLKKTTFVRKTNSNIQTNCKKHLRNEQHALINHSQMRNTRWNVLVGRPQALPRALTCPEPPTCSFGFGKGPKLRQAGCWPPGLAPTLGSSSINRAVGFPCRAAATEVECLKGAPLGTSRGGAQKAPPLVLGSKGPFHSLAFKKMCAAVRILISMPSYLYVPSPCSSYSYCGIYIYIYIESLTYIPLWGALYLKSFTCIPKNPLWGPPTPLGNPPCEKNP